MEFKNHSVVTWLGLCFFICMRAKDVFMPFYIPRDILAS